MGVLLSAWTAIALLYDETGPALWPVLVAALLLAGVSWIDDLRGLPAWSRLAAHLAAVVAGLAALPESTLIFQGLLPTFLDRAVAGLLWLWFVNLFNFMDGIDGIAGVQSACLGIGLALVFTVASGTPIVALYGLTAAGAALGFLAWNWHPAKIFMGDVGSVPLGYLLGWLLLTAAASGYWAAAMILPLYYLADASITLARRVGRGARIWHAHREHFYQTAVRNGSSHAVVVRMILAANIVLIGLALAATYGAHWPALIAAGIVVGTLLYLLVRRRGEAPGP